MKIGLLRTLSTQGKIPIQIIASMRSRLLWLFSKTSWLHVPTLACLLLAGCGNTVSWDEEVKLRTGEIITVEREAIHVKGGGEWAQGGQTSYPVKHFIRFGHSSKTEVPSEWESKEKDTYDVEYPLVLDIDEANAWYIFTTRWVNDSCIRYVKYKYEQKRWVEQPLTDQPIDLHETNLYLAARNNSISGTVTVEEKNEKKAISNIWFYKQVGPNQVTSSYFEGRDHKQKPPLNNLIRCVWEPTSKTFKLVKNNGDKK
jgi:hypothetical protein